jgi:hypothetical protein
MKRMWGALAAVLAAAIVAGGCASNQSGVLVNTGSATNPFTADFFLPGVNTVDSGEITLTAGLFNGSGNDLVFTEPFSTSQLRIPDQAVFSTAQPIYDMDGDGAPDYIVLTLRALSAQAARSVSAIGQNGAAVAASTFYKVGGIAILPISATLSTPAQVTLPVNAAANPAQGTQYPLYKWDGNYAGPQGASASATGVWRFVEMVTVDSTGNTVTFPVSSFGEYAVVASAVTPATT